MLFTPDAVLQLIETYGLLLLAPIAVLEGPIVTVVASYIAKLGYMNIGAVYVICVMADLVGDAILFWVGRYGPRMFSRKWQRRFGLNSTRRLSISQHFNSHAGKTLLLGKITHSAGAAVLLAAGVSRMKFLPFLGYNLLGTLPKTLLFVVLGYTLGHAYTTIDNYIYRISIILLLIIIVAAVFWFIRRKWRSN